MVNVKEYNKLTSKPSSKTHKSYVSVGVRSFIKGLLQQEPMFGLKPNDFGTEESPFVNYQDIINFVYDYNPSIEIRLTKQSISNLRNRRSIVKNVPRIKETLDFANYVKSKISHFDIDSFLKR
jgi:hypothetical protein